MKEARPTIKPEEIMNRLRERIAMKVAWAAPRWLVYWCSIRLIAHATQGKYSSQIVPELGAMDALKRWTA